MNERGSILEYLMGHQDSLVVQASLEDCVYALKALHEPWSLFSYRRMTVRIRELDSDTVQVKVFQHYGKSRMSWKGVLTRQAGGTLVEGAPGGRWSMALLPVFFIFMLIIMWLAAGILLAMFMILIFIVSVYYNVNRRDQLQNTVIETLMTCRTYGTPAYKKGKRGVFEY